MQEQTASRLSPHGAGLSQPKKELARGTAAAPVFFNSFVHSCAMVRRRVFWNLHLSGAPLTMRQGLVGDRMIQEAGPPR
jgi:hypothetical protein